MPVPPALLPPPHPITPQAPKAPPLVSRTRQSQIDIGPRRLRINGMPKKNTEASVVARGGSDPPAGPGERSNAVWAPTVETVKIAFAADEAVMFTGLVAPKLKVGSD